MPLSYDLTTFLDSRAEICQIFRGIFGKSKISKEHSEIIWPLERPERPQKGDESMYALQTAYPIWLLVVVKFCPNWNLNSQTSNNFDILTVVFNAKFKKKLYGQNRSFKEGPNLTTTRSQIGCTVLHTEGKPPSFRGNENTFMKQARLSTFTHML